MLLHQADVCHAYQILRKGGLKEENIIVFMYDDIAFDEENPRPGVIINKPDGGDVYEGVPKVSHVTFLGIQYTNFYFMFNSLLIWTFFNCRITLVQMLLLTTFMLLYLEINQLLQVEVERLLIVAPMITYLFTTLIMEVQGFLVSSFEFFTETFWLWGCLYVFLVGLHEIANKHHTITRSHMGASVPCWNCQCNH